MKTLPLKFVAAAFLTAFSVAGSMMAAVPAHAATVPCEDMLKTMRGAKATAKLSDADMAKVNDLEAKAVERCNADDDTRSDKFVAEAMKLMGQ